MCLDDHKVGEDSFDSGGTDSNLTLIGEWFRAEYQGYDGAGVVHNTKPPDIENSGFAVVRWEGPDPEVVDKEKQEDLVIGIRGKDFEPDCLDILIHLFFDLIHTYQLLSCNKIL